MRSREVRPGPPWLRSSRDDLRKLWSLPPLTYSNITNIGSRSVQHPNNRTTFGWGSKLFITFNSWAKSRRSRSLAFSLRVLTATIVGPVVEPISKASHLQTWPKQPSPRILKTCWNLKKKKIIIQLYCKYTNFFTWSNKIYDLVSKVRKNLIYNYSFI